MTRKEAEEVYRAASFMSNWLYNMKSHDKLSNYYVQMDEMVKAWDATKIPLRDLLKPKKRNRKS